MTIHLIDKAADPGAGQQERRMKASPETRSQHERLRERRPAPNVDQVLDDSFPASDPPSFSADVGAQV